MLFKALFTDERWLSGDLGTTHIESEARIYDTNSIPDMQNLSRDWDRYCKIVKVGD